MLRQSKEQLLSTDPMCKGKPPNDRPQDRLEIPQHHGKTPGNIQLTGKLAG
uniref:Uncharacterized protein n=1 Tax=Anguilla anguilla TaxID=7936 RepID=A0A0E9XW32_ANGAN